MHELMLGAVSYGGYISLIKLVVYAGLFLLWLFIMDWVYRDASGLGSNEYLWTGVTLGVGVGSLILWLVIPIFFVGLALYAIAVGGVAIAYVKYRNARVLEFDRVLTSGHIKKLFSSHEQKRMETMKSFLFITANKNEIPMPAPRTPEFYGYKTGYDLFTDAIWRRASTVILLPAGEEYKVTYFIDGVVTNQPSIDREQMQYFITFMKSLADLNVQEKRKPQKGRFWIKQEKEKTEWEIISGGSSLGEQLQFKHVTGANIKRLSDIGLMADQEKNLDTLKEKKPGVFIVSGPKKSGVTTTFYALLRNHDAFLNSINTLEKKTFGELPNITQQTFKMSDSGTITYGRKLQSLTRTGPDIIGIADCEDAETAKVVCDAVKQGILCYVTMEAENAVRAIVKWIKLVEDKEAAMDVLSGASNQRLVRRLCAECKEAYRPNADLLRKFNLSADKVKALYRAGKVQYDKHGKPVMCEHCQGTGFYERMGIFETIMVGDELRKCLKQAKSLQDISNCLRGAKMLYLQERGLQRVIDGSTGTNEMIKALTPSQESQKSKERSEGAQGA